jgi:hypothetical protein
MQLWSRWLGPLSAVGSQLRGIRDDLRPGYLLDDVDLPEQLVTDELWAAIEPSCHLARSPDPARAVQRD